MTTARDGDGSVDDILNQIKQHVDAIKDQPNGLDYDFLAQRLGLPPPPGTLPAVTRFTVHDASLDLTLKRLQVVLESPHGDGILIIYRGPFQADPPAADAEWRLYIGVKVGGEFAITKFPIAGSVDEGALGIRGVQLLFTSHDLTDKECVAIYTDLAGKPPSHELGGTDYTKPPTPPLNGVTSRITFKTDLEIAAATYPLVLQAATSKPNPPSNGSGDAGGEDGAPSPPPPPSASATVNKQIGSLKVSKIFAIYDEADSKFGLGLNASIDLGVFTAAMDGLTVSFNASDVSGAEPHFGLKGLEISGGIPGAVEFGGGLYVQSLDPLSLWGAATLDVAKQIGITVMAGYSEGKNEASYFGFGFVGVPIGGPPFLEIKGIAAGFAYNRDLVIPPADQLDQFPFIQAAMSFVDSSVKNPFPTSAKNLDALAKSLEALGDKYAPAKPGRYWGTLGLAFTSFELVNGFALVSLTFGNSSQISVIGEMRVEMPPKVAKPLIFIDSFLRIVVDLDAGEIALDAYIKHNSYLVESLIHLTGGLAVRIWYGSEHAGEFVVSAGGYSPHVDMSPWPYYPVVPRLAASLDLGGGIQITARMYFSVTSSMAMYGLAFQVSGKWGPVEIWAVVAFDAFLAWEPIHYDVAVAVNVGASLRIKVWFVHITITVHVGASLHIWGPDFTGEARLDLSVCTVSWHLGAHATAPPPLAWPDFEAKYLPRSRTEDGEPPDDQHFAVSSIQAECSGLIVLQRADKDDPKWVVDPETTVLRTRSAIPSKAYSFAVKPDDPAPGDGPNTAFGVGPCGIGNDHFHTTHIVTIETPGAVQFSATPVLESVPAALWRADNTQSIGPDTAIKDVLAGLELRPVTQPPDHTLPADADNLLTQSDVFHLPHLQASSDHAGNLDGSTVSGTIASAKAVANRIKLFAVLGRHLLPQEIPDVAISDVDVSGFANTPDADLFTGTPRMRLLGEDRA
jgi:hypothetical protein